LSWTATGQVAQAAPDGSVSPQSPQAFEQIWVTFVCIDLERCAGGSVSMSANTLTVIRYTASCLVCGYPTSMSVELGRLPAGSYTVRVVNSSGTVRSTQALTVSDPHPAGPYAAPTLGFPFGTYTDQWWDPDEPGWGIAITQHVSGAIFAVWAVYGPDSRPVWYTLQPGSWTSYNAYSGPVYRTVGPWFGGNYGAGPAVTETLAGTATLRFNGSDNATLQFTVDNASGAKPIRRLGF